MKSSELSFISLFHIGIAIHQLNKRAEKSLGLSLVQWCLLKCLVDMPASSAHALSSAVGVHPSTLTQTLKRLERKQFIFIMEDPKDCRKKLISITRLGKAALDMTSDQLENWSKHLMGMEKELLRVQAGLAERLNLVPGEGLEPPRLRTRS
jgi:DNA-binding MarR family transcriptional regulator